ncbi:rCG63541 [Rattus norvegicus]|uniref:RCG63541 n=1 Tax=Rattus norvegicus TaxID=10116 RepID=A6JBE7_RAT|nr:rCG63541 [Rattus norvegicus]
MLADAREMEQAETDVALRFCTRSLFQPWAYMRAET